MIPGIGSIHANRLLAHFGSAENIFKSSIKELESFDGIRKNLAREITSAARYIDVDKELQWASKLGVKISIPENDDYPPQLRNIPDPPIVIYYRGNFTADDIFSVAVVGTRKPTSYGRIVVEKLVKELAGLNVTIISGLARGIDTYSHWTAIKSKGRTIAVLGNGLSVHYPPENRKLEETIVKSGLLISEFPIASPPDKANFPRRNRLIAALSLGTVIVEADIKSGALITARSAVEQGKDVFAVPGSIFSRYSLGPHRLLKQGAKLVESAEDIVEEILSLAEWITKSSAKRTERKELPLLNSFEQKILLDLEKEPQGIHIDRLQFTMNQPFSELSQALISLELKNLIKSLPGKIYLKI
jgi:DNA processing protein